MRKFLGLFVLVALLIVPTAALAKPGKGKGGPPDAVASKTHGSEADDNEAEDAEAPETEAPDHNTPGTSHGHGKSAEAKANHAGHIPTGHAQEVLAGKVN